VITCLLCNWPMILFWYTAKFPECTSDQFFTVLLTNGIHCTAKNPECTSDQLLTVLLTNDIILVYCKIPRMHQWSIVNSVIDQWCYSGVLQNSQNASVINCLLCYWPMILFRCMYTAKFPEYTSLWKVNEHTTWNMHS
jgi:hypothetical protein